MAVCVIGLIIVAFFVKETAGRSLRGSTPAVDNASEIEQVLKNPNEALWWEKEITHESINHSVMDSRQENAENVR